MKRPDKIPREVYDALDRFRKRHNIPLPFGIEWDGLNGCYYFVRDGVYHGVETDGHIHT